VSERNRDLSQDEALLWARATEKVRARSGPPRAPPDTSPPLKPTIPRTARPETSARPDPAGAPANRSGEKRVRRGRIDIGGTLDLHGHTQTTGRSALVRFLALAQARGDRTVIVVTGAGRNGEGVLKQRLPEWLGEPDLRPFASGYAPAHRSHGGAGAFYVFVKRPREYPA